MPKRNAFYAQSGGVTAVINASACGVIETARKHRSQIGKVYAGRNGIIGALQEDLIDTSKESAAAIHGLLTTPAGAFGSCRHKLKSLQENPAEYERLLEVFKAHNIDLPLTDNCPGFGSVAKYIAISTREAAMDVASMCETSTKVFILEVMGRHAGWIAAASGLAATQKGDAPHIILFPEIAFDRDKFMAKVQRTVKRHGYCVIVASEGAQYQDGTFLAESGLKDAFGHSQLGGLAPQLAQMITLEFGYKYHWAVADYLQRSARHIASQTDVDQAYAVGEAAVTFALRGDNAIMPCIVRGKGKRYTWSIGEASLENVANREKKMPRNYISRDGLGITDAAKAYLTPLIAGEAYPEYRNGLPNYVRLKNISVPRKLKTPFKL
jgi:ATP-dependent phosphofructokinase / diphosphate-dependent phosphofructokinase